MNAFKCPHCNKEIDSFEIHDVFVADFSSIHEEDDIYNGYNRWFGQTTFHCPECRGMLTEDKIMEHCN